jgi:hypothetical protein
MGFIRRFLANIFSFSPDNKLEKRQSRYPWRPKKI